MGCASSSAFPSGSRVQAINVPHKDAGSQTNVSVFIPSTKNARLEARDARDKIISLHRTKALEQAKGMSNSRSGNISASYTGSDLTTPNSSYSRSIKHSRSNIGSISDGDYHYRMNSSNSLHSSGNLNSHFTHGNRTKVSFRNDEYEKIIVQNDRKRRKPYRSRPGRKFLNGNDSGGSVRNSLGPQTDTGYEGSISSVPSSLAIQPSQSNHMSSAKSMESDHFSHTSTGIIQTVSNESHQGRLSIVVSIDDEQGLESSIQDNSSSGSKTVDQFNLNDIPELLPEHDGRNSAMQNSQIDFDEFQDLTMKHSLASIEHHSVNAAGLVSNDFHQSDTLTAVA